MAAADYTLITRQDARLSGAARYFTGKPCKHGHVALRLVVNGSCCECSRLKAVKNYRENREENLKYQKIRRDSDPNRAEKRRARQARLDPTYVARMALYNLARAARLEAKSRGESQYYSGKPCANGHVSNRFTSDGRCVECNRQWCLKRSTVKYVNNPELKRARRTKAEIVAAAAERELERIAKTAPWRAAREARQAAIANGDKTYQGKPCPYGHDGMRFTRGGNCIECTRIISASPEKKAYDAVYGKANREKILARTRIYHEATKLERIKAAKEWARKNPEKRRAISKTYKAKRRAQEKDGASYSELMAWESAAKKVCHWCNAKCPKSYHVDHYVPLSKGGKHELSNLVIACRKCNLRKSAKDPYEFAASVGRLF